MSGIYQDKERYFLGATGRSPLKIFQFMQLSLTRMEYTENVFEKEKIPCMIILP
jgi:hypothetical protein